MLAIIATKIVSAQGVKSPEELELGNKLRAKYPDNNVCVINSTITYTFEIDNKDSARAYKTTEAEYVALKDRTAATLFESYDDFSSIESIKGFNKEKGKYKNIPSYEFYAQSFKLSSDEVFDDDNKVKVFGFYFETLGQGKKSICEKRISDLRYLTSTYFQSDLPHEISAIKFEIPDWLEVELKEFNFEGQGIVKNTERNEKEKKTIYTFTLNNAPAIKSERLSPAISKSFPHVLFIGKKYKSKKSEQVVFEKTDDLYKWYKFLVSKSENNPSILKPVIDKIVADKKSDTEKIKALFYWVQDNIRYIAFERGLAGYIPEPDHKVFENKFGDCKGMANLLNSMLKQAGYDSRLGWIGTSSIPYDFSSPSLVVNNHMICVLMLKDSIYYLDGTEKFIPFGQYADRISGRPVMIENGDTYLIKTVPTHGPENNRKFVSQKLKMEGETLTGSTKIELHGETETYLKNMYTTCPSNKKEEAMNSYLTSDDKNFTVTNIKTSDLSSHDQNADISYDLKISNSITTADNEVYISIDPNHKLEKFIPDAKRQNDFDFREKINFDYKIEFAVPEGYKVKYIPEEFSIDQPGYTFYIKYEKAGNKILLTKKLILKTGLISHKDFETWKKDLKKLTTASNEQIIITK